MPDGYSPIALASAVLPDGRVIFAGGEYNGPDFTFAESNMVTIYDPVTNVWTTIPTPNFFDVNTNVVNQLIALEGGGAFPNYVHPIGDAQSVILEDGTFMLAAGLSNKAALLDAKTLTWTPTGDGKHGTYHEEGWTLLPNGKVLTIDCYEGIKYPAFPTNSEIYNPKTGKWKSAGSNIVPLSEIDSGFDLPYPHHEIGPALLRPDGTVFALGDNGNSAIYDWRKKRWSVGPTLPLGVDDQGQLGTQDGGSALLPNGNVLFVAGPLAPVYVPPYFFEFNGKEFIPQPSPNLPLADTVPGFNFQLLVLPTGQILATDTANFALYTPGDASYNPKWAPVVTKAPKKVHPGETYKISGRLFNGMS